MLTKKSNGYKNFKLNYGITYFLNERNNHK